MNLNDEKGFSLVEVLIAITLLAIGLLAVAGMQVTAISGNSFAQGGTAAIALAEEMVDRVRTNAGTTPETYNGIDTSSSVSALQAALSGSAEADALSWKNRLEATTLRNPVGTVAVSVNTPTNNVATITVTVSWGANRNVTLTTILETWGT
jgi:type IV pilus assembly protein PilV